MSKVASQTQKMVSRAMNRASEIIQRLRFVKISRCWAGCIIALLLLSGCAQEMENQRRVDSQEQTKLFADGSSSRAIPGHAILASRSASNSASANQARARGRWLESADANDAEGYLTGKSEGAFVNEIPEQVRFHDDYQKLIQRGRERFSISCVPCHDQIGSGNGMVARRGLKFPPSYHTERLRHQSLGYLFDVVTNGRGKMPAYGDALSTDDRWAIVAYVRTLQFSQYAPVSELSSHDLKLLEQQAANSDRTPTGSKADGSK